MISGFTRHTTCRVCSESLPGSPFLSLGMQPLANNLYPTADESLGAPVYPLDLLRCTNCGLIQLSAIVDPETLFSHYLYTPDSSTSFHTHFKELAQGLEWSFDLGEDDLAVDIGSNSGLLLSMYTKCEVLGIEPAKNLADDANARGIPTMEAFWGKETAARVRGIYGPAKIITGTNVFAHCADLHDFFRGVDELLTEDGMFVIEVPALPIMLKDGTFDLIYHEHLSYFDLHPLDLLATTHGFNIYAVYNVPVHGGSYRIQFQRVSHNSMRRPISQSAIAFGAFHNTPDEVMAFASRVRKVKDSLLPLIRDTRGPVIGYGAPAKATVLISYLGLTADDIDYIVDDNPLKAGKFVPGTAIPIVPRSRLEKDGRGVTAVIFPWNIAADIIAKLPPTVHTAIVPMPAPRVVNLSAGVQV